MDYCLQNFYYHNFPEAREADVAAFYNGCVQSRTWLLLRGFQQVADMTAPGRSNALQGASFDKQAFYISL